MIFQYLFFQIHGGADHGHGGVAETLDSLLSFLEGLTTKSSPDIFSLIFPGITGIENIHPMLVHFPIAYLPAFLIIDLAGTFLKKAEWRWVASWFLYLGAIMSVFAVVSGFMAGESVAHGDNVHSIMEQLELYGVITLVLAFVLSVWRLISGSHITGPANGLFLMLSTILCVVIMLGADLGGMLVYKYGISVQMIPTQMDIKGHNHTHFQGTEGHDHAHSQDVEEHDHAHSQDVEEHDHAHSQDVEGHDHAHSQDVEGHDHAHSQDVEGHDHAHSHDVKGHDHTHSHDG